MPLPSTSAHIPVGLVCKEVLTTAADTSQVSFWKAEEISGVMNSNTSRSSKLGEGGIVYLKEKFVSIPILKD